MKGFRAVWAITLILIFTLAALAQALKTTDEISTIETTNETWIPDYNLRNGAVYVMTNQTSNAVLAFVRWRNGALTPAGYYPTGGAGSPNAVGADSEQDRPGSQGALVLNQDKTLLFAVNSGSNEITSFKIGSRSLQRIQTIKSGGNHPISIAVFDDLLYVLNDGVIPVIAGFRVAEDGTLSPVGNSVKQLSGGPSADPVQIGFNNDGTLLIVTDKSASIINSFKIDINGMPTKAIKNVSVGSNPRGFAFSSNGDLVVAESSPSKPGSLTSYSPNENGMLNTISGAIEAGGSGSCCVVVTNNALYAFVLSPSSSTIFTYRLGDEGTLYPPSTGTANTGDGTFPIDMALSSNSGFLYVLDASHPTIKGYQVTKEGSLKEIGTFFTLPAGIKGIAVR